MPDCVGIAWDCWCLDIMELSKFILIFKLAFVFSHQTFLKRCIFRVVGCLFSLTLMQFQPAKSVDSASTVRMSEVKLELSNNRNEPILGREVRIHQNTMATSVAKKGIQK